MLRDGGGRKKDLKSGNYLRPLPTYLASHWEVGAILTSSASGACAVSTDVIGTKSRTDPEKS